MNIIMWSLCPGILRGRGGCVSLPWTWCTTGSIEWPMVWKYNVSVVIHGILHKYSIRRSITALFFYIKKWISCGLHIKCITVQKTIIWPHLLGNLLFNSVRAGLVTGLILRHFMSSAQISDMVPARPSSIFTEFLQDVQYGSYMEAYKVSAS